jgi:hypothetical protein
MILLRRSAPECFWKRISQSLYRREQYQCTDFQKGRIRFAEDLIQNMSARVLKPFSKGFGIPLVRTNLKARSFLTEPLITNKEIGFYKNGKIFMRE